MKNLLKFIFCAITTVICIMSNSLFAQVFNVGGGVQDRWGQTNNTGLNNTIRRVGIGDFENLGVIGPRAALNIDANLLTPVELWASNTFLPGEVFRTDGPSTNLNAWRLWTGGQTGGPVATEKGALLVPANTSDFIMRASEPGGTLQFQTRFNFGSPVTRMIIYDGSFGYVGIGLNYLTPDNLLDVDGGDIDVNTITRGYMINDNYVLWHNGNEENIFVGVGAGNNNLSGTDNTFAGENAGNSNVDGNHNTAVGSEALQSSSTASDNDMTAIGYQALKNASGTNNTWGGLTAVGSGALSSITGGGFQNTAIGGLALHNCINLGVENTAVGAATLFNNLSGSQNTAIGDDALYNNKTGNYNTAVGTEAIPNNDDGNYNTALGYKAGISSVFNLQNTIAIGALAQPTTDYTMILGNQVNGKIIKVGIGLSGAPGGPLNCLEINADPNSYNYTGNNGSGLKFRQLTSLSNPSPPYTSNVLSVDDVGNVILIPGGGGFGAACGGTPYDLTSDWRIGLNDKNLYFENGPLNSPNENSILIGSSNNCNAIPFGKLQVFANSGTQVHAIFASATGGTISDVAIRGQITSCLPLTQNYGVLSEVSPTYALRNYGVYGFAMNGRYNYGVYGITIPSQYATGINYGVYGLAPQGSNNWAGWFSGPFYYTGPWQPSDTKLKENIRNINNALELITEIKPRIFDYKNSDYPYLNLPTGKQYGIIADELFSFIPELTTDVVFPEQYDTSGNVTSPEISFKCLNYTGLIPIAIQAIKELDSSVTVLQNTTPPNKPVLASPADSISNMPLTITFSWERCVRATSYILYINQSSNQVPSPVGGQAGALRGLMINTTDTFVTVTLSDYNTSYNWEVVAYNDAGSSDVSDVRYFTTELPPVPAAPFLVFPQNSSTSLPLANTFRWNKSLYADGYTLYISTTLGYAGVVTIMTVKDTFANASVPNYNTAYYWWVKASNISGTSAESDIWSFTTRMPPVPPSPPLLISPANGDSLSGYTMTVNFYWHKSPKATSYSLYVSNTPDEMGLVYNTTIIDTFNMHPVFGYNKNYYWWVVACNQNGCGTKSNVWRFFIKPYGTMAMSTSESTLSDSVLKTDVTSLNNAIDLISQMQPVRYYWDTINNTWLSSTAQIGLVGQQVQNVVPEVVFKDSAGYYNIQYGRLVALLVSGMKEQQSQIDSLKSIVMGTNQKSTDENSSNENQSKTQYVELASENVIILNQNDPNPFAEETDITYYLPDNVNEAKIMFYDNTGKIIKAVELIGKGNGTLHVYASNLSSGIYTYALIADGKVIDTKKMMKSE